MMMMIMTEDDWILSVRACVLAFMIILSLHFLMIHQVMYIQLYLF